ncbi:DinB family protein [Flavisolibacter tropicus]|uniref:DinB-like domain-containing protein n=1 Tax=Flavisolibacter tropicus TaxID=1492898 RepID=A0A172TZS0_9BACT|nr:DinB family protein [Flavisolibacter tropicus]ANE52364.1 hypothetical protein SY85_19630 [Flavisolibacter tropicus]
MDTIASIQKDLQAVTEKLIQLLQSFTPDAFTKRPAEQNWSAAEVAEHLLIVNKNLSYVLKLDGATPDRDPDKKLAVIKEALSDRTMKIVAPESVKPTGTVQNQQELVDGLQYCMQQISRVVGEKDLYELCEQYPHPRLGRLTRFEWLYFIIYHTERHCSQLADIYSEVEASASI